jgi:hypothetical protein
MAVQRSDYIIHVISNDNSQSGKVEVFIKANTLLSAPTVQENWETGSMLWAISEKKMYMLNSAGEWVEM